ncbi:MAG: macro domain-containing protein [bacterium]
MPITYKKGSLFDAPTGSILVHAVSTQSVWGSGIAKEFKARFPESFEFYKQFCEEEGERLLGVIIYCPVENGYVVNNLVTSIDYGTKKDPKDKILEASRSALRFLLEENPVLPIHSCKFNSGLFGVPWEETEKVLLEVMTETGYNKIWTVWEL